MEGVTHPVVGGTLGYPPPSRPGWGWGYPWYPHYPDLAGGYPRIPLPLSRPGVVPPCPDLGWGTPLSRPGMGYPPIQTWDGVTPPPVQTCDGVILPSRCGLTHKVKILPSPILRMRPVIRLQFFEDINTEIFVVDFGGFVRVGEGRHNIL